MLGLVNLGKSFGGRTLFEGVSLQLNVGNRYGLVGANGSGKTTLLKVLSGDEPATDGSVNLPSTARMSVLRQDRFLDDEQIILDLTMMGDTIVWAAMMEEKAILATPEPDAARMAELEDVVRSHDGYTLEARASAILEGLGVPRAKHRQPLGTLSGGFKLRVLLAQVLLGGPDLLLLDEPTNHLDILSIRWLERFLASYAGCAIVISHDIRFLDNVATHILDVDYETITLYTGNYSAFEVEKQAIRDRKEAEIARTEKIIAEKRAFVDRFGAKATKAKQAQSRLKQIEKIEVEELANTSRRTPKFRFQPARPSGRDVLTVEGISKSYGSLAVLKDISLTIRRGEKVAVIGPNGLGKSTLLKIATGNLEADAGTVKWGHEAQVGYFAQDHTDLLTDPKMTPLEFIWAVDPMAATSAVRGQLGLVLFSGEEVDKPVGKLSGGEAARLIFCKVMAEKSNVLVLDEPTNHLDIEAIHALSEALKAFEGTVLFVSHDRWFVSQLATRILEITPTGLRDFPGTYTEYLERCGDDHLDANAVALKAKREKTNDAGAEAATTAATATNWEAEKRRKNRLKSLPGLRDKVMAAIDAAEARKTAIHASYASPGFFEKTPKEEVAALEAEDKALEGKLETLIAEWEGLEKEIADGASGA
ncbi:MAG: ABC-F family ATP-binding cassette domain-containing protein [Polyangiaceae bacterium]|nr:ABC-F family ATP-binding cassette domain-containing protein [Polyangiaceae bacterium]